MNHSFFARFSKNRHSNHILKTIAELKRSAVFRRARFDIYLPSVQPKNMIVLLGQVHTVWKGKIGNRERNNIVNCQARLCSYYATFVQRFGVREFGGEGLYEGLETSFTDRACFQLYSQVESKLGIAPPVPPDQLVGASQKIFQELGKEWHVALREQRDLPKIQLLAAAVSGMTLFNFLSSEKVKVYPVEGEKAYQEVLRGVTHLGERIQKLENSYEMKVIRQHGGKASTEKEVEVVKQYNLLVKEFNRVLGSDIRERATMEILRDKGSRDPITVFTMGVGHRKNYLALADEYLGKTDTAFVFITAPELRINLWIAIGVPVLLLMVLIAFGYFF